MSEPAGGRTTTSVPSDRGRGVAVAVACLVAVVAALTALKYLTHQVPDTVRYLLVGAGLGAWAGYHFGRRAREWWAYAVVAAVVAVGFVALDNPGPRPPTAEERLRELEDKARGVGPRLEGGLPPAGNDR